MSSNAFWRNLSRLVKGGSAPATSPRGSGTRRAPSRKARLLVESLEDRMAPAVVTVAGDPGTAVSPTPGSLRWAILTTAPGLAVTFAINDTVNLSPVGSGGNGELVIGNQLTIDGAGHTVVVNGQNLVRDFDIATSVGGVAVGPVGVAVNFKNLTIQNGLANGTSPISANGGGILASSPLAVVTMLNVNLLNNTAANGAGVYAAGSLGIYSSTLDGNNATGNGGAALANRMMVIDSSTITDNHAFNGGGVYEGSSSPVVITGTSPAGAPVMTLFQDNTADNNGGAVWANFNVMASNSNFDENQAITGSGGGIFSATGNVTIDPTLVTRNFAGDNGGGIWANRNIVSIGSYVTANQAFGDGATPLTGAGGGLFSLKGNVVINGGAVGLLSASSVGPGVTLPPALIFFGGNTAGNPLLAPGGPGVGLGGGIYSGADVIVTGCAFVEGNLAMADGGGIWANGNVHITTAFVDLNAAMGNGGGIATGPSSISTVILLGAFVYSNNAEGNNGAGNGGGVYTPAGNIYTEESAIFLNVANGSGGGLYDGGTASSAGGGAINLYLPTVIDHNTSTGGGGGVFIGSGGVLTVEPIGATMFGITAAFLPPSGAATACNTTVLPYITVGGQADPAFNTPNLVNDPTTIIISNNSSGGSGGGIDAESSEGVTLLCTWVFGNTASSSSGCGGGVYLHNVLLTQISYSTFQNNVSKSACGGGIAAVLDRGSGTFGMFSMSVDDSTFAANKGATNGGGVYLKGVDAYFNHDTFNDNQLTSRVGSGGVAIYADTRANAYLENVLADDTHGLAHGLALLAFGGVSPAGVISSMGHNLSSDNSLSTVVNFNILNGDIANGIQGLTALDFHGGCTPTYNLVAGGQAIGAGDLLGPITDQNFVSRPIGSASDIGAVQH